jgi:hypothetical protein
MGSQIALRCATKWLNLNNRGCLTHGCQNYETSDTKCLNYNIHCSAHFGAEVNLLFPRGFSPTVIEISPLSGRLKKRKNMC